MGAFELKKPQHCEEDVVESATAENLDQRRLREECIIAFKVYDQCRSQDCLTANEIGPARAAECKCVAGEHMSEGDVIDPPDKTATVTIDRLRVKKVIIVNKEPNAFKQGYWDVDLKYVFEYRLTFRDADGGIIDSIKANSIFNKRVTLFGSVGIKQIQRFNLQRIKIESRYITA